MKTLLVLGIRDLDDGCLTVMFDDICYRHLNDRAKELLLDNEVSLFQLGPAKKLILSPNVSIIRNRK